MKPKLLTLFCVVALSLGSSASAYAALDELEELLSSETNPGDQEATATRAAPLATHDASTGTPSVAGAETKSFSDRAAWHVTPGLQQAGGAAPIAEPKPQPPSGVNAVPEPSAIILALAALAYFLLFGRRRRV